MVLMSNPGAEKNGSCDKSSPNVEFHDDEMVAFLPFGKKKGHILLINEN